MGINRKIGKGVFDEPRAPLSRKCAQDLDHFAEQLSNPSLNVTNRSQSLEIFSGSLDREFGRLSPTDLSKVMKDKCLLSLDVVKDKKSAKKKWRKRILERKSGQGKVGSCDIDETVELSFDQDKRDTRDMSFESTSSRSSGLKSNQVSFSCDSSIDASDLEADGKSSNPKKTDDTSNPDQQSEQRATNLTKKDKESKRQRLKRIITRPLRRSQSECCEKDIPSHALFLETKGSKSKDTMESRAMDLLLYQRLFGNSDEDEEQTRRFRKTCSADSALVEGEEFLNNNTHPKSKSRNLAKNMRKRFQFLRRQNTDTVVDQDNGLSLFTMTTYEQALQWSKSLDALLRDKIGLELFLGFLRSEFSEENLEFWIACEEFRTCNGTSIPTLAQKIYNDFVVAKAPKEINLDSDTRMETILGLQNPSHDTFDVAQHKIQALMAKDSYPRFLESDFYQYILGKTHKFEL